MAWRCQEEVKRGCRRQPKEFSLPHSCCKHRVHVAFIPVVISCYSTNSIIYLLHVLDFSIMKIVRVHYRNHYEAVSIVRLLVGALAATPGNRPRGRGLARQTSVAADGNFSTMRSYRVTEPPSADSLAP